LKIDEEQHVAGIIDFGDAHRAPRICDLAIACTYFMMNQGNPWVALRSFWVHHACGDNYLYENKERLKYALLVSPAAPVVEASLENANVLDLSPASSHPADPFSGAMPDLVHDGQLGDSSASNDQVTLGWYRWSV